MRWPWQRQPETWEHEASSIIEREPTFPTDSTRAELQTEPYKPRHRREPDAR